MGLIEIGFNQFSSMSQEFEHIPFSQSPAWVKSRLEDGRRYTFYTNDTHVPDYLVACEFISKPVLGEVLLIDGGPLIKRPVNYQSLTSFLKALTEKHHLIELNCETELNADLEVEVRRSGFVRPIWAKYCPMTIYVDPTNTKLKKDWKYRRNKAVKAGVMDAEFIEFPSPDDIKGFVQAFEEMKETKGMTHIPSFEHISSLTLSDGIRFYRISDEEGPLAYRLIWHHKLHAHDIYAANFNRARDKSATHKMMIDILESLKLLGVTNFDFGRIGPGIHELDSVFTFKRGSGGKNISYLGEWSFSKSFYKEILLMVYRKFIEKRKRW